MSERTLKKITYDSHGIQVESAVRDGNGNVISSTYLTKAEYEEDVGVATADNVLKNKYHLGAFDTVDTSNDGYDLITRQTEYVFINDESSLGVASLNAYSGACTQMFITTNFPTDVNFASNILIRSTSYEAGILHAKLYDGVLYFNIPLQTNHANALAYTKSLNILIEVQSSTSYTEKVIKNQPLSTLDQRGEVWLRSEYEKGLNIWDEQWMVGRLEDNGSVDTSISDRRTTEFISVKPNTKYAQGGPSSALNGRIAYYNDSKTFISYDFNGITEARVITTPNNCYFIRITIGANYGTTYNNDIIINEGDHAYPYKPYSGQLIRQPEVDKALYNLGAFDYKQGNKIIRQTGYLNLSKLILDNASIGTFRTTVNGYQYGPKGMDVLIFNNIVLDNNNKPILVASNGFVALNPDQAYYNTTLYGMSASWVTLPTAFNTKDKYLEYFNNNNIVIEYKLTTSYTETIIPDRPLNILDSNGSQWIREEWEKELNLFMYDGKSITIASGSEQWYSLTNAILKNRFGLVTGKTYTIKAINLPTGIAGQVLPAYTNFSTAPVTFTMSDSTTFRIGNNTVSSSVTFNLNIMLVEGSIPYPYKPYYGKIMRNDKVLLWENGNPTSTFGDTTVTLGDYISKYKYLIFKYKLDSGNMLTVNKIYDSANFSNSYRNDYIVSILNSGEIYFRKISFVSTISVRFHDGYFANSANSNAIIPIAIYGSNHL